MQEKRIAFLFFGDYPCGGAEFVISIITSYIASHGFKVYIAGVIREEFLSDRDKQNATFVNLTSEEVTPKQWAKTSVRICQELQLDILAIQCVQSPDINYVAANTTTKLVFCEHGKPGWERTLRKMRRIKKAERSTAAYLKYNLLTRPIEWLFNPLYRQSRNQYRLTYNTCAAYTLLCEAYKEPLCRMMQVDGAKFHAINNPLLPLAEEVYPDKKQELIYMGRLTYEDKRVDKLLQIWALLYREFPDWTLSIVGDGAEKEALKQLSKDLSLERIFFRDYTTDPLQYYRHAAILCLTSDTEGWGMVLAEAQQAGVIPVAFDCSAGVRTILAPTGENGMLVPPAAGIQGYAQTLRDLMSDEPMRRRIQQNGIIKAKQYDLDYIGAQWCDLFDSVLKA
ncbi:MAG: glycosyltransferase [Alistipes sp.]